MKKIIAILLVVLSISVAFADTDFSSMSYDELIELQKSLTAEIMSRPEWKEVNVPSGVWIVGEDIPAGTYSIRIRSGFSSRIDCVDAKGRQVCYQYIHENEPIGKIVLLDGYKITISAPVIFAPPVSLGF